MDLKKEPHPENARLRKCHDKNNSWHLQGFEELGEDGFLARDGVVDGLDQSHYRQIRIPAQTKRVREAGAGRGVTSRTSRRV